MVNYIIKSFKEDNMKENNNKAFVMGKLIGIEEEGTYKGKKSYIALMKTERDKNKPLYIWILFNSKDEFFSVFEKHDYVFIEGEMCNYQNFNDKAVSHTFILPEKIEGFDKKIEISKNNKFHLNFTVNNRIILEGEIGNEPWREFIPPANNYVTRFSLNFYDDENNKNTIYCTLWDTVNSLGKLKKGQKVKVLGSFSLLKKDRGLVVKDGIVIESKKNKLDSYVIVVQKIELVNEDELDISVEDNKIE